MAIEVTVGPPLITITRGSTFVISEPNCCISPYTDQGVYSRDTRFISHYDMFADGERWLLQNSGAIAYYASRAYLTNPKLLTEHGEIGAGALSLTFSRAVHSGIHEDIDICNYSMRRVRFCFELSLRTDFADIFEVKMYRFVCYGHDTDDCSYPTPGLICLDASTA